MSLLCLLTLLQKNVREMSKIFTYKLDKQYSPRFLVSIIQTVSEIIRSLGLLVGL